MPARKRRWQQLSKHFLEFRKVKRIEFIYTKMISYAQQTYILGLDVKALKQKKKAMKANRKAAKKEKKANK